MIVKHAALTLLSSALISAILFFAILPAAEAKSHDQKAEKNNDIIPNHLFIGQTVPDKLPQPSAPKPAKDKLILPPGEEPYFPTRQDNQPLVLNVDRTVNLTEALNRFYYDPKWRGEVWVPFNQFETIERATRQMATWPEYDQANVYRKLNRVNQWFERKSGFGP